MEKRRSTVIAKAIHQTDNRPLYSVLFILLLLVGSLSVGQAMADSPRERALTWQALQQAPYSPEKALTDTLNAYPGLITEYEVDDENGHLVYELTQVSADFQSARELTIDAITGKVLENNPEDLDNWLSRRDNRIDTLLKQSTPLVDILRRFQKNDKGHVVEAELKLEKGILFFELEVNHEGKITKHLFDAGSGKPIPVYGNF